MIDGCLGVLDHEIGHAWGICIGPEVNDNHGHWLDNSTAWGQMGGGHSDDGYETYKMITGDPVRGFGWYSIVNTPRNPAETFSDYDLYLAGMNDKWPDMYVFDTPVYNPDNTVSCNSYTKYDQDWVVARNGVRNPDYRSSQKRFRMGFIYVARNLAEIQTVYQPIERSVNFFVNGEAIDNTKYLNTSPFLVDTQMRGSVDGLLADLDGNHTPKLSIVGEPYALSTDGSATIYFTATDADGPAPTVSCVTPAATCTVTSNSITVTDLAPGAHFLTIKAQDAGGKKCFAHFVVDVQAN